MAAARMVPAEARPAAMRVAGFDIQALVSGDQAQCFEAFYTSGSNGTGDFGSSFAILRAARNFKSFSRALALRRGLGRGAEESLLLGAAEGAAGALGTHALFLEALDDGFRARSRRHAVDHGPSVAVVQHPAAEGLLGHRLAHSFP